MRAGTAGRRHQRGFEQRIPEKDKLSDKLPRPSHPLLVSHRRSCDAARSDATSGENEMDAWLDRLQKEIEETTRDLLDSDWRRAPEGRWSCAQILEHLGRSYGTTAKMLELRMGVGGPPQLRAARISEFLTKVLILNLEIFPSGALSPTQVRPQGDPGPVALQRALHNLERMDLAITSAEERWGSKQPVAMHPVLGPLSTGQWRKFHFMHGHHHVLQMRKSLAGRTAA